LLAVGAASDASVRVNFVGTVIYFAIATAGEWNSPSGFQGRFNVEVDTNGDEVADHVLRNSSLGNFNNGLFNSGVASDVFLPILRRQSNGVLSTNGVANVFSPAVLDTAPLQQFGARAARAGQRAGAEQSGSDRLSLPRDY
jgi:hypothetical protein